jgi:hypothetical protein
MTARTTIQSMSGAVIAISATLPATYDASGYGATAMTYTTIGEVENFGNHGMTATITEFTPVASAVVAKVKGSKNYGTMSLMMADVPANAGQVIVEAAAESTAHYSVKITYPVGDGESTGAIHYLDVLVAKKENQDGSVNDVRKLAADFAICKKPVVVAAT